MVISFRITILYTIFIVIFSIIYLNSLRKENKNIVFIIRNNYKLVFIENKISNKISLFMAMSVVIGHAVLGLLFREESIVKEGLQYSFMIFILTCLILLLYHFPNRRKNYIILRNRIVDRYIKIMVVFSFVVYPLVYFGLYFLTK